MAGCFGNSPYDRHLESQLNDHLRREGDWDSYCEAVADKIPQEIWDGGCGDWFETSADCTKLLTELQYEHEDLQVIADKLIEAYNNMLTK